jgi:hypothetical protein
MRRSAQLLWAGPRIPMWIHLCHVDCHPYPTMCSFLCTEMDYRCQSLGRCKQHMNCTSRAIGIYTSPFPCKETSTLWDMDGNLHDTNGSTLDCYGGENDNGTREWRGARVVVLSLVAIDDVDERWSGVERRNRS